MKPPSPPAQESFLSLVKTHELPDLGPRRRPSAWPAAEVRRRVAGWLEGQGMAGSRGAMLLGAALLWHDCLHEAHELAQKDSGADGSFLHAVMHRREPDFGNSNYWWHRVGSHPCFPALAGRVLELLTARQQPELAAQLLPGGRWNPGALVDACEVAADEPAGSPLVALLQEIQALEFEAFVSHLLRMP